MSRHTNVLDTFYVTQLDVMTEVVSTWPNGAYYMEKLQRLRCNIMEKGAKAFDAEPKHFNTLIHGDMYETSFPSSIKKKSRFVYLTCLFWA